MAAIELLVLEQVYHVEIFAGKKLEILFIWGSREKTYQGRIPFLLLLCRVCSIIKRVL